MKIFGIQIGRTEAEKWAEAKLDSTHNARAATGLTPAQIIARQQKAVNTRNKRNKK